MITKLFDYYGVEAILNERCEFEQSCPDDPEYNIKLTSEQTRKLYERLKNRFDSSKPINDTQTVVSPLKQTG
jgi:hypothetical protein